MRRVSSWWKEACELEGTVSRARMLAQTLKCVILGTGDTE